MCESVDGFTVSATRQNAGSPVIGAPLGGVNVPAETDCASVMVVAGMATDVKLSQVAANVAVLKHATNASDSTKQAVLIACD